MSFREELAHRLRGRIAIVGVGNPLWADDGAGPALIRRLQGTTPALLVDGGDVPERYYGTIVAHRPETILVIDAVDWGGEPGSVAILDRVKDNALPLSTHRIPLNLFLDLLRKETGADLLVLGIQPRRLVFNGAMSPAVQQTLGLLEECFSDILMGGVRCC